MSGDADFVPELPQVLALTSNFIVEDETDANSDDESTQLKSTRIGTADAASSATSKSSSNANANTNANANSISNDVASSSGAGAASSSASNAPSRGGAAAAQIPDVVRTFVEWWYAQFRAKRTFEIHAVYESHFNKVS
jgi:hypothetical protein